MILSKVYQVNSRVYKWLDLPSCIQNIFEISIKCQTGSSKVYVNELMELFSTGFFKQKQC